MKKYDLIKMAGWIAVAIGGLVASWATDKQSKEEIDKKLEEYITEKTDKSATASHRPNQDYYVAKMNAMSFSRFIYPENKEDVLDELRESFKA